MNLKIKLSKIKLNKKLFLKIYISIVIILAVALIILQILGSKSRAGYLSEFDLLETNYNENTTNYSYRFMIRYYDKVFRNSDIYGVYPNLSNLPEFVKEIKMDEAGSPFGNLVSDRIIEEDKIDINYTLKLKSKIIIAIFVLILAILIFKIIWNKFLKNIILSYSQNIELYEDNDYIEYNPIYEILLSIPALWIFITSANVVISKIINKINYNSYLPYTIYPAVFILLFIILYLLLYKKMNMKVVYIIRLNLIYMLLYFFIYCFRNDMAIKIIILLHIILIILTPRIYKLKLTIEYNFSNKFKYRSLIRNQLLILILFYIFYFIFNVGLYLSLVYYIEAVVILLCRDLYKIYNKKAYKIIATVFTALTLIFLIGDNMSSDLFSDANVYTAGMNYKENGFLKYYFLPDFSLPNEDTPLIYTHYPPIPDIMFGILYKILPEPKEEIKDEWYGRGGYNLDNWIEHIHPMLWKYRMFPLLWHIIGSFLLWASFRKISKDKFLPMISILLTVSQPALLYCKFNLHYLAYGSSVLMATPYIIYQFLNTNKKRYGFILLFLGFLQGGLSFDFILPGVGISLLFLFFPLNKNIYFNKKLLYPAIILAFGVAIALILHFIQNSLYFDSVKSAFNDFHSAFLHRSSQGRVDWLTVEDLYFFNLIREYYAYLLNTDRDYAFIRYFGFPLVFISILFSFICSIFGYLKIRLSINKFEIKTDYFKRSLFFLLGALAVSSAWVLIMRVHSAIHVHIIPRHFIVLFIAVMTFLITFLDLFDSETGDNKNEKN